MKDIETKIVSDQPFRGLKVKSAEFDKVFSLDGKMELKPVIEVELKVEGRKHPVRRSIVYSFCPFCGKSYDEKEAQK